MRERTPASIVSSVRSLTVAALCWGGRRFRGPLCAARPVVEKSALEPIAMKITEKQVRYVADLANLALTDEEIRKYCADLDEILVYVDKLNEVDTSQVEPMAQVIYETDETATLRPDSVKPSFSSEVALANAPLSGAGQFKVPKVVER